MFSSQRTIVFGILGVLLTCVQGKALKTDDDSEGCLDLAIIGAGIGGTYSAWRLKDRGMSIEIFEQGDRIGGRLFTFYLPSMPNVGAELGGMRYIPGTHTVLESLIHELELESTPFQPSAEQEMYYLRGVRMTREELSTDKLPYRLKPGEPKDPVELEWKLYQEALNMSNPGEITDYLKVVTPDGNPLYEQGYHSLMGNIWSNEAREYLKAYNPARSFFEANVNAVNCLEWGIEQLKSAMTGESNLKTVIEGFDAFPKNLAQQFVEASENNRVNLKERVDEIKQVAVGQNTFYTLTIMSDSSTNNAKHLLREVCAEQVIIAVPRRAQQAIKWDPLQNDPTVMTAMNSVMDIKALKIFMVYSKAWWDKLVINYKSLVTDLPLQQTMEFGRYTTEEGHERAMLLHYVDEQTTVDYWNELRKFEGTISSDAVPAHHAVSKKVAEHVHYHLAELFNIDIKDIPDPIDGIMTVWRDAPYWGGWHVYRPGFNAVDTQKVMKRPSQDDKVYVVSNSYSAHGLAYWCEGSLRAADEILGQFFP